MKITVTRSKLYPCIARPGPAWRWTYNYSVDDGPSIGYGSHLASLRDMLKRHFPGASVTYAWKV